MRPVATGAIGGDGATVLHSSCGEDGEVGAVFIADFDILADGLLAVLRVFIEANRFQCIDRHCERSEAIQRAGNGLLGRFAPRNDERNWLGQRALV